MRAHLRAIIESLPRLRLLGLIFSSILGIAAWLGQVAPEEAMSNYSAWYELITNVDAPAWMESKYVDVWGSRTFAILSVAGFVWFFWPQISSLYSSDKKERIFVDITPEELTAFFSQLTTVQAKKLVEDYIGKWMPVVASSLGDVGSDYIIVNFGERTLVLMLFDRKWKDQLSVLKRGSHVKAIGQIKGVDGSDVTLWNCEIINSSGG